MEDGFKPPSSSSSSVERSSRGGASGIGADGDGKRGCFRGISRAIAEVTGGGEPPLSCFFCSSMLLSILNFFGLNF